MEISKVVIYEFSDDYMKPKYGEKSKLYYMDTGRFIVYIKAEQIYVDVLKYVEGRFGTSNYEIERKKSKRNWINKRWVTWENNKRVYKIDAKNIWLINRRRWMMKIKK